MKLYCLFLLPALVLAQTEPKRPLAPEQELKVIQDAHSLTVSGETFSYTFDKANGLIGAVRVLGRQINGAAPIPDLTLAEQVNPETSPFSARNEKQAQFRLASADAARVAVEAEGRYTAADGRRFPLRYSVRYEVSIDGVVLVTVNNTALEDCSLRWLTLSAGAVRPDAAQFINWIPEQASSQQTDYRFRPLAEISGDKLLAGTWIPWLWLGDRNAGLEITTYDVSSQTYNRVDGSTRTDESEMFVVRRSPAGVRWDNYLIRRTRVFAKSGWTRGGQFALAVTPSKKVDPYYALFKGAHFGPHQHTNSFAPPDEKQIQVLARNGYNLIVGMANWRSGEYVPLNEGDLRRTIELCHRHGVKIIPYITLMDLAHSTTTFRDHGEEWAIEPTTEFDLIERRAFKDEMARPNDDERETTLMCPGAAGWRAHWQRQIERVIRDYDFDGLYFDFWFGRMVCENTRHGCGGRYRKASVLGAREMLTYAYNRLKAKNPRAIIKANTNTLSTALITSLVDIRLVGEATDAAGMDPASRQWLYTSHRLGEPTEILWSETKWNAAQRDWFATLVNFLPQYYQRPGFEARKAYDDFDVFRSFDDGTGEWSLGIAGHDRLRAAPATVLTNVVERGGRMLATVLNTTAAPVAARLPIPKDRSAWEPLTDRLLPAADGTLRIELGGNAYRHVLLAPKSGEPRVLYTLGARQPAAASYDAATRTLRISVDSAAGARVHLAIDAPQPVKQVRDGTGAAVPFRAKPEGALTLIETSATPVNFTVTF